MPIDKPDQKRAVGPAGGGTPSSGSGSKERAGGTSAELGGGSPSKRPWLLRKRGSLDVLRCPNLLTLRTWMVERRVTRDDEISRGGKVFRRIGNVVELESLFHSADVERAEKRKALRASGLLGPHERTEASLIGLGAQAEALLAQEAQGLGVAAASPVSRDAPAPAAATVNLAAPSPPSLGSGTGNPLRTSPSGQPNRLRPPVPAVPIVSLSEKSQSAVAPGRQLSGAMRVPPLTAIAPPSIGSAGRPGLHSGAPTGKSAPTSLSPGKGNGPSLAGVVKPERAASAQSPADPTIVEHTDHNRAAAADAVDPTRRLIKLEQSAEPTPPPLPSSQSGRQDETLPFIKEPASELALPGMIHVDLHAAASDTEQKLPAPMEEALRRSDPVPRSLRGPKDSVDPNRTAQISAAADPTERVEPPQGKRGLALVAVSLGVTGALVLALHGMSKGPDSSVAVNPPTPGQEAGTDAAREVSAPRIQNTVEGPVPTGKLPDSVTGKPAELGPEPTPPVQPEVKPEVKPEPPKKAPNDSLATAEGPKNPAAGKPGEAKVETASKPGSAPALVDSKQKTTEPGEAAKPAKPVDLSDIGDIPKTFDGQIELAQNLVEKYQYDKARRLFEMMLGYADHVPALHVGLGKCALEQGRSAEAISHYQDALKRADKYGPAIFGLGKAYRQQGNKESALVWFKKYIELYPNSGAAQVARDTIARLEGRAPQPSATPAPATPAPAGSELVKPSGPASSGGELVQPR